MWTEEGGSYQCKCLPINLWNAYLCRPSKKKVIQKWAQTVVKSGKRSGVVQKEYHWIKNESCEVS